MGAEAVTKGDTKAVTGASGARSAAQASPCHGAQAVACAGGDARGGRDACVKMVGEEGEGTGKRGGWGGGGGEESCLGESDGTDQVTGELSDEYILRQIALRQVGLFVFVFAWV